MSENVALFRKRTIIGTIINLVVLIVLSGSFDSNPRCFSYAYPGATTLECRGEPFAYVVEEWRSGDREFHGVEFFVDILFWTLPAIIIAAVASWSSIVDRNIIRMAPPRIPWWK